jgi:hypothetical protein
MECDIVDLVTTDGDCLMLHTRPNEYGSASLKQRDAYILCKVTVNKRPLTEDEIEELDNVKNNIKSKKKPTKKVDIENLIIENGYVVNKEFSALLDTEEGKNLESMASFFAFSDIKIVSDAKNRKKSAMVKKK